MSSKLTSARIQELENCFSILDSYILLYKRLHSLTSQEMQYIAGRTIKLLDENNSHTIIVDMTEAILPSLQTRKTARKLFSTIRLRVDHMVVIVPNSYFVVSMNFIFKNILEKIHLFIAKDLAEAQKICREQES